MTETPVIASGGREEHGFLHEAARGLLAFIALALLALIALLLYLGITTGFPGLKPYPPTARLGALQGAMMIEQEIELRLREGLPPDKATTKLPWDKMLTHWHKSEDVTLEGLQFSEAKIVGGKIHFSSGQRRRRVYLRLR
jgi:hypothetical protein